MNNLVRLHLFELLRILSPNCTTSNSQDQRIWYADKTFSLSIKMVDSPFKWMSFHFIVLLVPFSWHHTGCLFFTFLAAHWELEDGIYGLHRGDNKILATNCFLMFLFLALLDINKAYRNSPEIRELPFIMVVSKHAWEMYIFSMISFMLII